MPSLRSALRRALAPASWPAWSCSPSGDGGRRAGALRAGPPPSVASSSRRRRHPQRASGGGSGPGGGPGRSARSRSGAARPPAVAPRRGHRTPKRRPSTPGGASLYRVEPGPFLPYRRAPPRPGPGPSTAPARRSTTAGGVGAHPPTHARAKWARLGRFGSGARRAPARPPRWGVGGPGVWGGGTEGTRMATATSWVGSEGGGIGGSGGPTQAAVRDLAGALRGPLLGPGTTATTPPAASGTAMIDRRPALIARCAGAADVIAAVTFARDHACWSPCGAAATTPPGTPSATAASSSTCTPMKGVRVDPAAAHGPRPGAASPGASSTTRRRPSAWRRTGGIVSNTGVAGLTLGGGQGWLMGQHGLACDNLLVGRRRHRRRPAADAPAPSEHADLFWGAARRRRQLRRRHLVRVPAAPGRAAGARRAWCSTRWPAAGDVLRFYREFAGDLPDEAEAYAALLTTPDGAPVVALVAGLQRPAGGGRARPGAGPPLRLARSPTWSQPDAVRRPPGHARRRLRSARGCSATGSRATPAR